MSDESVHEIQLNGKQLVFMFMTATVAAVVIFLCGVMVGRGVNPARAAGVAEVASETTVVDPTSTVEVPSAPSVDAAPSGAPVSTQEVLTYAGRLEAPEPPPEPAVEPVATPVPAIIDSKQNRPAIVPTRNREVEATSATTEPKGQGFVVQVAAVRSRSEADAIARRLSSRGFKAFVTAPGGSAPQMFRVRVGKYNDRREAETVARRLEKEEQFKPWITR
jgi:cell division septation protein DedD